MLWRLIIWKFTKEGGLMLYFIHKVINNMFGKTFKQYNNKIKKNIQNAYACCTFFYDPQHTFLWKIDSSILPRMIHEQQQNKNFWKKNTCCCFVCWALRCRSQIYNLNLCNNNGNFTKNEFFFSIEWIHIWFLIKKFDDFNLSSYALPFFGGSQLKIVSKYTSKPYMKLTIFLYKYRILSTVKFEIIYCLK